MKHMVALLLSCGLATLGSGEAQAQAVALTGMLGDKALLVVDGGAPKGVATGDTYLGVKVVSTLANTAVVEVAGARQTLRVGELPISVKGKSWAGDNGKIVLQAGGNGHFISAGQINGQAVQFMVDTGASVIAMGVVDAERIGLKYKAGQLAHMSTANGVTQAWRVKLSSVRLGSVEVFEVEAVVLPSGMQHILLGNSFLTRFQMTRTNDQMVLEKRY